ncbi:MAG: CPBP family intramembrane metalloprotease [Planctomycetia bacterium]|nr:CPBP family intramembrane metalloprotease [Planctomycetia bacterium]
MKQQWELGALLAAIYFAVLGWAFVIRRLRSRCEILDYEPRRSVPWGGAWVLWAAAVYIGLAAAAGQLASSAYLSDLSDAERVAALSDNGATLRSSSGFFLKMIQAHSAANLFTVFFVTLALVRFRNAGPDDLGISMRNFPRRLKQGFLTFFVVAPPTLLLQAAIVEGLGIKYNHPLVDAVKGDGNGSIVFWCSFAAVVVAPLVEEFLFRVVLQGWLERLSAQVARQAEFADDEVVELAPVPSPVAVVGSPAKASFMPIFVSSLIFAAVHLEQWPAPIPLFFFALALGYLYRQTHSIWPCVVVHFMLNALSMIMLLLEQKQA